jgi:uncharacterized protein
MTEVAFQLSSLAGSQIAALVLISFVAAIVGGMSGMGGGILVSIFIAPIIGVRALVPTLAIAMLIAHLSRVWVYRRDIDWRVAAIVAATSIPAVVLGSILYVDLSAPIIGAVLGLFLIASIPLRRIADRRLMRMPPAGLAAASGGFGFLSGLTLGGGMLVIPILMSAGLLGPALIATDAVIGLGVLIAKASTFSGFELLTDQLVLVGLLIGTCMIPGTFVARALVVRTGIRLHTALMETIVVLGGLSFLWRALETGGGE